MEVKLNAVDEVQDFMKQEALKDYVLNIDLKSNYFANQNGFELTLKNNIDGSVSNYHSVRTLMDDLKQIVENYISSEHKVVQEMGDFRVVAVQDIPEFGVKKGDIGGKVQESVRVSADSWISYGSEVGENSIIRKNSLVSNGSEITNNSKLENVKADRAFLNGEYENVKVENSTVSAYSVRNSNIESSQLDSQYIKDSVIKESNGRVNSIVESDLQNVEFKYNPDDKKLNWVYEYGESSGFWRSEIKDSKLTETEVYKSKVYNSSIEYGSVDESNLRNVDFKGKFGDDDWSIGVKVVDTTIQAKTVFEMDPVVNNKKTVVIGDGNIQVGVFSNQEKEVFELMKQLGDLRGEVGVELPNYSADQSILAPKRKISEVFPDRNFREALSEVLVAEGMNEDWSNFKDVAPTIDTLNFPSKGISNIDGIQNFKNLVEVDFAYNNISKVDFSSNPYLEKVNLEKNQISKLNVPETVSLKKLEVARNGMKELVIGNQSRLSNLSAGQNNLKRIDLDKAYKLETLSLYSNKLSKLDLGNSKELTFVQAGMNKLSELNLKSSSKLEHIGAYDNKLKVVILNEKVQEKIGAWKFKGLEDELVMDQKYFEFDDKVKFEIGGVIHSEREIEEGRISRGEDSRVEGVYRWKDVFDQMELAPIYQKIVDELPPAATKEIIMDRFGEVPGGYKVFKEAEEAVGNIKQGLESQAENKFMRGEDDGDKRKGISL